MKTPKNKRLSSQILNTINTTLQEQVQTSNDLFVALSKSISHKQLLLKSQILQVEKARISLDSKA